MYALSTGSLLYRVSGDIEQGLIHFTVNRSDRIERIADISGGFDHRRRRVAVRKGSVFGKIENGLGAVFRLRIDLCRERSAFNLAVFFDLVCPHRRHPHFGEEVIHQKDVVIRDTQRKIRDIVSGFFVRIEVVHFAVLDKGD